MFGQLLSGLKAYDFWNTQVQPQKNRDGSVRATIVIDPITHEHLNVTVKTPSERVLIDSIRLPLKVKPFELVRPTERSSRAHKFMDVVRSYGSNTRAECKVDGRKVQTFDDVAIKAPLTKCYSVLAKDCSSETPRFAVLMKKINGEDKKIKVVSGKQIIEVQPGNNGKKLQVKVNGDRVEDAQDLQDYGIDYDENMVHIETRDVSVSFDGQKAWIKLAQTHKNTQCGLCGHYNDDAEDEFRMANNENTWDVKEFHRGYTVSDNECKEDLEDTHRRERYERIDSDEEDRSDEWKQDRDQRREDRDQKREGRDQDREEKKKQPHEKTDVMEYNHKICFSDKPVKECPRGTENDETKEQKIKYLCLERSSTEARRLLREARRNPKAILELPEQNPSYTETKTVPTSCRVY
jgi:hypothetical protein